jgi:hypothetical protein
MLISQLVPFARSAGNGAATLTTMTPVICACGNAVGRILSEWMTDKLGRISARVQLVLKHRLSYSAVGRLRHLHVTDRAFGLIGGLLWADRTSFLLAKLRASPTVFAAFSWSRCLSEWLDLHGPMPKRRIRQRLCKGVCRPLSVTSKLGEGRMGAAADRRKEAPPCLRVHGGAMRFAPRRGGRSQLLSDLRVPRALNGGAGAASAIGR